MVNRINGHVQVNAVQQRAGKFFLIAINFERRADAGFGAAVVAARAGVFGGDQYEVRWVGCGVLGARDRDFPIFQGLAERFDGRATELW